MRRPVLIGSSALAMTAVIVLGGAAAAWGTFTKSTSATHTISTNTVAAPTSLTATGTVAVLLSWTSTTSAFATGSRVFRSTTSGSGYAQIAQVAGLSTTTYTDAPGTGTFYYVVEAYYSGNGANWTSANSNQASSTTAGSITFVQVATGGGTSASIAATFSATPQVGDLLVAVAGTRTDGILTGPSGWSTAINQSNLGTSGPDEAIFYKLAGPAESTTVTVATTANGTGNGIHVYEYSGVTTLATSGSASGSSAAPTSGSVTTTSARSLVLAGLVLHSTATFSTFTNGFTTRANFTGGSGPIKTLYGGADLTTSATGTYSTSATSNSGLWEGEIVAFK